MENIPGISSGFPTLSLFLMTSFHSLSRMDSKVSTDNTLPFLIFYSMLWSLALVWIID